MVQKYRRLPLFIAGAALLLPLTATPASAAGAALGGACHARLATASHGRVHLYCGVNPKPAKRASRPLVWKQGGTCYPSITSFNATRASLAKSKRQLAAVKRQIASLPKDKQAGPLAQLKPIVASMKALTATMNATRNRLLSACR